LNLADAYGSQTWLEEGTFDQKLCNGASAAISNTVSRWLLNQSWLSDQSSIACVPNSAPR